MKKLLLLALIGALALSGCRAFHIGPKGEGEYVVAESLVPYDENNLSAMKKEGELAAQKAAVEQVAGVFISSTATVEQAKLVDEKITSKSAGFVRRGYVQKAYRKADQWYTRMRVMVLVKDISDIIKQSDLDTSAKKATVLVTSRETINEEVSLKQDCKQAIYRALKTQPYALVNGENLSQSNLDNPTALIDKARQDGARFIILADVSAAPLQALPGISSPFKSYRARANLKVAFTSNYQTVAEGADQVSGLDALENIAAQKAISAACEGAAKQLVEGLNAAVNSANKFNVIIQNVNTIERLKKLQDIFKDMREIEDYTLTKYSNSGAHFEISANISSAEELAAKMIRRYNVNFTVMDITPQKITLNFI